MVSTREACKPPPGQPPRRSTRDRTPTTTEQKPLKKVSKPTKSSLRVKEIKRLDVKKQRANPPKVLIDPVSGDTVWVAPATKATLILAARKRRSPWLQSKRYLVTLANTKDRQVVYDRVARALADLETRILPLYGNRPWQCIVTVKEPTLPQSLPSKTQKRLGTKKATTATTTTSNATSPSPYFCWDARGRLELAAFPYLVDKMPTPPHFPGYRVVSNNSNSSSTKSSRRQQKLQHTPTTNPSHAVIASEVTDAVTPDPSMGKVHVADHNDEEEKDEEEESENEEEESEEVLELRELQERRVSGLSKLAWELKFRVPVPTIHYKWISPLRQSFSTRKTAWDQAVQLCQNEVILDRVLTGYGAHGKPIKLAPQPRGAVLKAGKLRFERDGLWIVGQEEEWGRERLLAMTFSHGVKDVNSPIAANTVSSALTSTNCVVSSPVVGDKQSRRLSGLAYYIQCHRKEHHQTRFRELTVQATEPTPVATEEVIRLDNIAFPLSTVPFHSTLTEHPRPTKALFSMRDAEKELRCLWKALTEQEQQQWIEGARLEQAKVEAASADTLSAADPLAVADVVETPIKSLNDASTNAVEDLEMAECYQSSSLRLLSEGQVPIVSASPSPPVGLDDVRVTETPKRTEHVSLQVPVVSPLVVPATNASLFAGQKQQPKNRSLLTKLPAHLNFTRSKQWCMNEEQIEKCFNSGMEHYDQIIRTVSARDLTRELEDGFDLLRERGKGRWDMNLPEWDSPDYWFLNDTKKSPWMPVVKEILGKDVVLIHKGMFLSMPGSSKQVYHQDGPHLTTQYQKPCHAINVFVPLVDLTLDNGPTEFCLGSHILGHEEIDDAYLHTPTVMAGTPIIFDYRLGHRGLSNSSAACRPIIYCTYAAAADGKEFRDSVNFSRKRYHRIGDLVEKGITREQRAEKRMRSFEDQQIEDALIASCAILNGSVLSQGDVPPFTRSRMPIELPVVSSHPKPNPNSQLHTPQAAPSLNSRNAGGAVHFHS